MNGSAIDAAAIAAIIALIVNEIRNYKGTKENLQEIIRPEISTRKTERWVTYSHIEP